MTDFIIIGAFFISTVQITAYRSVPEQTDGTPFITASNEFTHTKGIAISRDLHKRYGGPLKFGDIVFIEKVGIKVVTDLMNKRHKKRIDIWVKTKKQESKIWQRFKNQRLRLYKINEYQRL